jgi:osmoprotectant transport system substrate-binding protein
MKLRSFTAVVLASSLAVAACGSSSKTTTTGSNGTGDVGTIIVGSANFPENVVLMEIYAQALEAKGFKTTRKGNLGKREVIFPAMQKGELDLLPEYTNGLLSYVTKGKPNATDIAGQVAELKSTLPADLTVLTPSTAEDKDTITCNEATATKYSLKTLSDLFAHAADINLGGPPEFRTRKPFGLAGFGDLGAEFKSFVPLDTGGPLTVAALKDGKVDCANLFSTSGAITANNFTPLADDKKLVPAEAVLPFIVKAKATEPVTSTLDSVSAKLDTAGLAGLVKQLEVDKAKPETVATDWLKGAGLI